jgi:hypothetical protein
VLLVEDFLALLVERWPGKSGQGDKWIFCLRAARIAADQERA